MIQIQIANEQSACDVDEPRLKQAIQWVLAGAKIRQASISVAIVDDPTIHELNVKYLEHDYPTDVLSFLLEQTSDSLEGEVIASGDTAIRSAAKLDWSPADELLLYIVHGTLHLVGHDDHAPEDLDRMRAQERDCLEALGVTARYEDD